MALYKINKQNGKANSVDNFQYEYEGKGLVSPQKIIYENPKIITEVPELELFNSEIILTYREYATSRGHIDVILIGSDAELVIIETKLIKNPDAVRTVVAQIIDYIKAFGNETVDSFFEKIGRKDKSFVDTYKKNTHFCSLLNENIRTGNYKVIIVGDQIHPNVLGMIESIQSAPHLSFSLYLIELATYDYSENEVLILPRIVTNTVEVERSVIKIEIDFKNKDYQILSETPDKKGKGTKPILSWEEYVRNIIVNDFKKLIIEFRTKWINEIDHSINMGQVGFSTGVFLNGKRIPIIFIYDSKIEIISEKMKDSYRIPGELYLQYLEELKQSDILYDRYIVSNRVRINFKDIDVTIMKIILSASFNLGAKIKALNKDV